MLETSARLLRLLSLLQERREWSGPALAGLLGVTTRTVRRDVDRLRTLGYPVDASAQDGYRLRAGAAMPPLLLDDDEAVAVVAALATAPGEEMAAAAGRALAKLEQVLPARLRDRVAVLRGAAVTLPVSDAAVPPGRLAVLAAACRDAVRVRLTYTDGAGGDVRAGRRALPAGPHRPALVPARLRPGPRRLADAARRPGRRRPRGRRSGSPGRTRRTPPLSSGAP